MTTIEVGIETGEMCNRNGCKGIIAEYSSDGSCSCHINPPCSHCTTDRHYCPVCDWDGREEQMEADRRYSESHKPTLEQLESYKNDNERWQKQRDDFYKKFNGTELVTECLTQMKNIYK